MASTVLHHLNFLHSRYNSSPAFLCIAPSTPPPVINLLLAEFTIA
jgi:hypothetical protein